MLFSTKIDPFDADGSPIQQQIGEIYSRYSLLGTKLSDRQLELDTMRDECKKHSETLRSLATFLDKIERQMPRDSAVPQTRDDAEKQLRSVKNILEDMYDKQPMLDGLRSQVIIFYLSYSRNILRKIHIFRYRNCFVGRAVFQAQMLSRISWQLLLVAGRICRIAARRAPNFWKTSKISRTLTTSCLLG
jgi:hypothetical protein